MANAKAAADRVLSKVREPAKRSEVQEKMMQVKKIKRLYIR